MGRSRRRLKRDAPKVKVGVVKRKKNSKAEVPLELRVDPSDVEGKLKTKLDWTQQKTLTTNYKNNKLVLDPNQGFGRNQKQQPLKTKEERLQEEAETFSDDDELRVACSQERKAGKAPPPRLTSHQRQVLQRLMAKHGDDVEAMFHDTKLNRMQHSVGKLRELLQAHAYWSGPEARHDFRGPNKPYKRL